MIRALALAALALPAAAQEAPPYAGQDARDIAALSEAQIAQLEAGAGMGFALAAELNGWPGPLHILENAEALDLSEEQRSDVQAIWDAMNADAVALGAELIAAEAALDAAFEDRTVTSDALEALVMAAADAEGALRARHLAAHLEATPVLSRHQRMIYGQLRGYGTGGHGHGGH